MQAASIEFSDLIYLVLRMRIAYYILTADIQRRLIEIDLAALNECRHLPVTDNNVYYDRDGGRVKRAQLNVLASIQNGVPIELQAYQTKNNLSFTFHLTLKAFACKQAR